MDINSMYTSYLDQASTNAASAKTDSLKNKDYSNASDEELMDACKQFEAYFVEQVLKEMEKTIPDTEETDGATSQLVDYYKSSMVQELSGQITEQSNLGLAQQMYEQMKRNYGV